MRLGPMPGPATATRSPPATTVTRISSLKSSASETAFSSKTIPRWLRHGGRVDEVDLLLGAALQRPDDHRQAEQARVELGDPPEEGGLDALDGAALGELHRELAELLGERQEGAEHLHVLGADRGDVHRGRDDAAGERRDDLLGALVAGAVGGLRGRGPRWGVTTTFVVAEQRALGHRLAREHVERRAGDLAGVERVAAAPASSISPPRATFSTRTPSRIAANASASRKPSRLGRLRQVDRDEVGLRVDVLRTLSAFSTPSSR